MKYAKIKDGIVDVITYKGGDGLVECGDDVYAGFVYAAGAFTAPPPPTPEELAVYIREKRNQLLTASDWTQTADAPVDRAAWQDYRQALRDIPQQAGFPADITWPTKPE